MKFGDITATVNGRCESWTISLESIFTDNALVTSACNESDNHNNCAKDLKIMKVDGPGPGHSAKKFEEQQDSLVHVGLLSIPPLSFKTRMLKIHFKINCTILTCVRNTA